MRAMGKISNFAPFLHKPLQTKRMRVIKRYGFLLILLISIATILVACSKDDEHEPEPAPVEPKIEFSVTENTAPVFQAEGDNMVLHFTSSLAWAAVTNGNAGWLSISPLGGIGGNVTLTISASPNDTPEERSANITIKCGSLQRTITVTQKQKDALTVTSEKVELEAGGGEFTLEAKANVRFTVETDVEWLHHAETRAYTAKELLFVADENSDLEKREGHIILKGDELSETITVYQDAGKPSIILTQNDYVVGSDASEIKVEVRSNVEVALTMPPVNWINRSSTRAASTQTYVFNVDKNESYDPRSAELRFTNKENGLSETVKITQLQKDAINTAAEHYRFSSLGGSFELEAMTNVEVEVFTSTDWIINTDTRGLHSEKLHFTIEPNDTEINRQGTILLKGGYATQSIIIFQQRHDVQVDRERKALAALYRATDGDNWKRHDNWNSDRPLDEWYGVYVNEDGHVRTISLPDNGLSGELPESLGDFTELERIDMYDNQLTGSLPSSIGQCTRLSQLFLYNNQLSGNLPEEMGNLKELIRIDLYDNQLTGELPEGWGNSRLQYLYIHNNQLTGTIPDTFANLTNLKALYLTNNQMDGEISEGVLSADWWFECDKSLKQQKGYELKYNWLYSSSDYSQDGKVTVLQKHTQGDGVKLVITGEAFSDRQIAKGEFAEAAQWAMETFFDIEPYSSFRNYFDVYAVTAVSRNEKLEGDVAFKLRGWENYTTSLDGVAYYAQKVQDINTTDNVTCIVVSNVKVTANTKQEYNGFSISTITVGAANALKHEACGHAFGKLADEDYPSDPKNETTYTDDLSSMHSKGWRLNVDTTNDPTKVLWKDFLTNPSYAHEGLGIFEGARGKYAKGIYRATETSIMTGSQYAELGFNAPSRAAIVSMIMKIANVKYTFEDFLKYDVKNLRR